MKKKCGVLQLGSVGVLLLAAAAFGQISEPSTVFYGKVTGVGGAQPFQLYEGELAWTIEQADGSELQLQTQLFALYNGEYSYRLAVPHSVAAYGLAAGDGLPLPPVSETNVHARAFIDGVQALFRGNQTFAAGQALRTATYRLDLEVPITPPDSDADGMPDWWEDAHGFDKQSAADALADADGDGLSNLQEYLAGFNPGFDNRRPALATESLLAYPDCTTGVRLDAGDVDSAASNLVYTLLTAPTNGTLALRNAFQNPTAPDLTLTNGVEFTQADVAAGRLVFVADGMNTNADQFVVAVQDETGAAATGAVAVTFFDPAGGMPLQKNGWWAGQNGAVVWDAVDETEAAAMATPSSGLGDSEYAETYVPYFGAERPQFMLGGRGDDTLRGGWAADTLAGGEGRNRLVGGGGADRFILTGGAETIADFSAAEGDVLDLDALFAGASGRVDEYLEFAWNGTNTLLGIDLAGGGACTDLVVTIEGVRIDDPTAYDLLLQGNVLAGALTLTPRISVAATDAQASENGENSGLFTLVREGDLSGALEVGLQLGGAAENGMDYSALASTALFEPGISRIEVTVQPIADSEIEVDERVELTLQPGTDYVLHDNAQAALWIKDLQSVVELLAWEPLGSKDPLYPATLLVRRNGNTANNLFVMLSIGGSARNGIDYESVYNFVTFQPGQTTVPISITPKAGGVLSGGAETVLISILEDSNYSLADHHSARIILSERRDYLDLWQERAVPGSTESPAVFAGGDVGGYGIDHLQRYAYGMNPAAPDAAQLPQLVIRNGRCNVDVHRNPAAMDVEFAVEVSTDLIEWSAAGVRRVVVPELEGDAFIETYESAAPVGTAPKQYLRVKLIYTP